jgi:hemerythrin-like metal-binding protein
MAPAPVWQLDWDERLSVSIPQIDAEHRNFIRLINALNEAIIGRMSLEKIKECMRAILDDTTLHFAHEEALLKEWGYPGAEEHARKHVQITQTLHEIMDGFKSGEMEYEWIEAGLKVKQALIEHLLAEDMQYRDYWKASGAQSKGEKC